MSEPFEQFKDKQDFLDWIKREADFSRPQDKDACVFYSGLIGQNQKTAEESCNRHNYSTIEQTQGGKTLDSLDLWNQGGRYGLSRPDVEEIWGVASEKYAEQVEGKVYCYVLAATNDSAFLEKELPTLLENDKVTHINEIPREELQNEYETGQKTLKEIHQEVTRGVKEIAYEPEPHKYDVEIDGKIYHIQIEGDNPDQALEDYLADEKNVQALISMKQGETLTIETERKQETQTQQQAYEQTR